MFLKEELKEELNLKFLPHLNQPLVQEVCVGPPGTNVRSDLDLRNFSAISRSLEDSLAVFADRPPRQGDRGPVLPISNFHV